MKRLVFSLFWLLTLLPLCAQEHARIAVGAEGKLSALLNKPAAVKPATATPLGKSWYNVETETHVFTDQASFSQIVAVLMDFERYEKNFNGKKITLKADVVSRKNDELIVDFDSITPKMGIKFSMPYRGIVKVLENTDTKFIVEIRQTAQDSKTNNKTRNLYLIRYAEEVTINGKKYTYIRAYNNDDVNVYINLPGAKSIAENSSDTANEETLQMAIEAAKKNNR
jgi:hypothetical protein